MPHPHHNPLLETVSLSRRGAWAVAVMSCLTMAVSYLDRQTFAVLAPTITTDLQISDEAYGWLASAFSISYLIAPPIAGKLLDHVGVRRGLPVAVIGWSIIAALHALAPGFAVLFALRILLGLAESPSFPGAVQTVHRVLPVAERSRGLGLLFTGSSIGALIAPLLASYFVPRYGWRPSFVFSSLVGLVWIPLWMAATRSPAARRALDQRAGEAASATAQAGQRFGLILHRAVVRAVLVTFACAPVYAFVLLWGAKYISGRYGVTQAQIGLYLWLPPLLFDCGAVTFGHLASRHTRTHSADRPPRLIFSLAMMLTASCALAPLAKDVLFTTLCMGLMSAGVGGLYTLLTSDMVLRVPPTVVSAASGILAATQSLAFILASPLIGRSVTFFGSHTVALVVLGCWVLPGCLFWLWKNPPAAHIAETASQPMSSDPGL